MAIKPGSVKSGNYLYETFYVGNGTTQYFIKPLHFKSNSINIDLDFTFRYSNTLNTTVTTNFNIIGTTLQKIDSLQFISQNSTITLRSIKMLFREKQKNMVISRYTTDINLSELRQVFEGKDQTIISYHNGEQTNLEPTRKTQKSVRKLHQNLFVLLEP
ncbi:MAG: hypothetical protein H6536_07555 [Bacteroidales bacterium]|nr:hypothetical protein [Bacteroidales bacterium]